MTAGKLGWLALARSAGDGPGALDRAAHRRAEPGLVGRLVADPATEVLVLRGERAPIVRGGSGVRLHLQRGGDLPLDAEPAAPGGATRSGAARSGAARGEPAPGALLAYLGRVAGRDQLLVALPDPGPDPEPEPDPDPDRAPGVAPSAGPSSDPLVAAPLEWATLRQVGELLGDGDATLLTVAVALTRWHAGHPRCGRCGGLTAPALAGWVRRCDACGTDHHPRSDPAVIMAVVDPADRLLLARQEQWPERRQSILAGFVEPGESIEAAVRREVQEESGLRIGEVEYLGSQPWPFPASLMLGFRAQALDDRITVDGVELAEAGWWSREQLAAACAADQVRLPPRLSIARVIIEHWFGAPLAAPEGWR